MHGSYLTDILPGLIVMALGLGAIFVGATVAANAGVPADRAGLAAGLLNTSLQLGIALGLAIFLRSRPHAPTTWSPPTPPVRTRSSPVTRARLLAASIVLAAAALIALRTINSRGEPTTGPRSITRPSNSSERVKRTR